MPEFTKPLQSTSSPAAKTLRVLAAAAIAFIGILVITLASRPGSKDYIEYWSSAVLLVHHANPYAAAGIYGLEKAHGFLANRPLIMRNPPWALFLIAPLGFTSVRAGLLLWTLAAAACILASTWLLNMPSRDRALAFVFAPALASICCGQSSPFLLLGFSLFLRFHRERPFLAGASLLLMAIKPHLFFIFWVVLLAECIFRRTWLILAGGASALAVATAFSMLLDPRIWPQYLAMMRSSSLENEFFPTTSMLFRLMIDRNAVWLLFVPSAVAIVWGLWYFARHRQTWDWNTHGMLLMMVTILVSPYEFFSDEIVLLPSILFALSLPLRRRHSTSALFAINGAALLIIMVAGAQLSSPAYVWTPLAWLAWFLYVTRDTEQQNSLSAQIAERESARLS